MKNGTKIEITRNRKEHTEITNLKKVSAIVPNFNYARFLKDRIYSILNQTYPVYELIILDDASTDNSVQIINEILSQCKDIRVKTAINEKNSGSVFLQWKKGIEMAEGDYFWIAEADDCCEPDFLETAMKGFRDPGTVLSYTDSARIDDNNCVISPDCQDLYNMFDSSHWNHDFINDGKAEIRYALGILNTIMNVSSVVWKSRDFGTLLDEAGKYKVAGDWYLYLNILKEGKLAFSASSLNYYRKHGSDSVTGSVRADDEYREICSIQEMAAGFCNADMRMYRLQRLRRSLMDSNVSENVRKKRIAWIIPYPGKGSGGHRTIIQNVNALIAHGYECDIFVADDEMSTARMIEEKINSYYGECGAEIHLGYDQIGRYDLVVATGWQTIRDAGSFPAEHKAYFIQDYEPWFFAVGNEYLNIESSYHRPYHQITIGRWLSAKLRREFGSGAVPFDFCADLNVYHPLENVEKENAVCFIYQPEKPRRCTDLAVNALKIVKELRPEVKIYLYGSDSECPGLDAENLHIIPVEECNRLYNRCRAGLCMSATNPSRVPFEMMASGLVPVDLYRENNLYDMPECGMRLAEASAEGIAAQILELLDNPEMCDEIGRNGYTYMRSFPLNKGFDQFLMAVDNILNHTETEKTEIRRSYHLTPAVPTEEIRQAAEKLFHEDLKNIHHLTEVRLRKIRKRVYAAEDVIKTVAEKAKAHLKLKD